MFQKLDSIISSTNLMLARWPINARSVTEVWSGHHGRRASAIPCSRRGRNFDQMESLPKKNSACIYLAKSKSYKMRYF